MSPVDKAKDLFWRCDSVIEQHCNQSSREAHHAAAKACAIIVVKQMFENGTLNTSNGWYWEQVLHEINKL